MNENWGINANSSEIELPEIVQGILFEACMQNTEIEVEIDRETLEIVEKTLTQRKIPNERWGEFLIDFINLHLNDIHHGHDIDV